MAKASDFLRSLPLCATTVALMFSGSTIPLNAQAALTPLSQQGQQDFGRILSPQADRVALSAVSALSVRLAPNPAARILTWNEQAMELTALDHSSGPAQGYDQLGPHRSSRAMAIVHVAMYDAVNAITKKYKSYSGIDDAAGRASIDMAIAVAARDSLLSVFPMRAQRINEAFQVDQVRIPGTDDEKAAGAVVGAKAAKAIIDKRAADNSSMKEPDVGTKEDAAREPDKFVFVEKVPGMWQPDPISNIRVALGYHWGKVTPFVMKNVVDFRLPPPPAVTSPEYTALYREVKTLGGDARKGTPTIRKDFETFRGVFWAYDGTPGLCAPPRLYNQLALQVAEQNTKDGFNTKDPSDLSRYLALINVAMADTAIAAWDSKWFHKFWRPITAITEDDGNPDTVRDPGFYPLGAPATNARGPNFTPPFPAYPSGHAAFGGALFEVLRTVWSEYTSFTMVSDEFNGLNRGMGAEPLRDLKPVQYLRFSDPEWENARSRIWLGIHWQVDADAGVKQGNSVAKFVLANAFQAR